MRTAASVSCETLRSPHHLGPCAAFAAVEGKTNLTQAKLLYLVLSLVGLGMGLYKVNSMGLLPVTSADWVSMLEQPEAAEVSGPAEPLL